MRIGRFWLVQRLGDLLESDRPGGRLLKGMVRRVQVVRPRQRQGGSDGRAGAGPRLTSCPPRPAGGRPAERDVAGLQARSTVFAVSDDLEEHAPEGLNLALAEAAQGSRLDAVAGVGDFRT